jgi:hypothetical protein
VLTLPPDRQYGNIRGNKCTIPLEGPPAPETTMSDDCKSPVCKARLYAVLGEVRKANQIARSLIIAMEEDRVSATRHILHLNALRKYQTNNKKHALTETDVKALYEASEARDIDMDVANRTTVGPSANQSLTTSVPSTNQSLTPQSLSFNGFSSSDSDYIP